MGPDARLQLSGRALRNVVCEIDGGEALESGSLIKNPKSPGGNYNWPTASMFEIQEVCWPPGSGQELFWACRFRGKGYWRCLHLIIDWR